MRLSRSRLVSALLFLGASLALALPPPKNVQALPKDMSLIQVKRLMGDWSRDLGMSCLDCHKSIRRPHLDDTEMKEVARKMVRVQQEANKLLQEKYPNMKVTCFTCHRGERKVPADPAAAEAMRRAREAAFSGGTGDPAPGNASPGAP